MYYGVLSVVLSNDVLSVALYCICDVVCCVVYRWVIFCIVLCTDVYSVVLCSVMTYAFQSVV